MKLISMIDFVLKNKGDNMKYAKFLRKPLKLGMFVPCDKYGNVLEEPESYKMYIEKVITPSNTWTKKCKEYRKAKEKVLFNNVIKVVYNTSSKVHEIFDTEGNHIFWKEGNGIIEDFIDRNYTLTENALKQIGL